MRTQRRIYSAIAILALLWLGFGLLALMTQTAPVPDSTAGQLGRMTGDTLVLVFFGCTGLPVLLLALFMRWRCAVGLREQTRHRELLEK